MRIALAALLALSVPDSGFACPAAPDHTAALADLFNAARVARTEAEGRAIGGQMWALWADAPDARAQELLDLGMARRQSFDLDGAATVFDDLIAYCPDYAEGYNQRAFVAYLRQDYERALGDLDRALRLSPTHVAALAGKALSLMGLGRHAMAQEVLRDALKLNPWLPERGLVTKPAGEDL